MRVRKPFPPTGLMTSILYQSRFGGSCSRLSFVVAVHLEESNALQDRGKGGQRIIAYVDRNGVGTFEWSREPKVPYMRREGKCIAFLAITEIS